VSLVDDHVTDLVVAWLSRPEAGEILIDQNRPDIKELRLEAAAMTAKLESIATKWADDLLTDEQVAVMTKRAKARRDAALSAMEDANKARLFKGVVGDGAQTFPDLLLDRRRAIVDALMTVTFRKAPRPGRFDPRSIEVDWKG
jgi:hypothetical protein